MLIAHPADRLNVARGLAAPLIVFGPFLYEAPLPFFVVAAMIFATAGDTNYILHLHIHRPFATKACLNLLLDLAMGAATAMTASNWRIQHRYGHHSGLDRPYRHAHGWETGRLTPLRALSYSLRSIVPTFWHPIAESFRKGVIRDLRHPIRYRWAFAEQMLLILFVLALGVWQPKLVLRYLLPWYGLVYFISRYVDYLNHYGCNERDRDVYARSNNSLDPLFNWSCNNFGYHTAHHLRPTAHWTELPAIHAEIADRIPPAKLKPFSWSCLLLPYHFVRASQGRM